MVHILPCSAAERHRSCDTYSCISPGGDLKGLNGRSRGGSGPQASCERQNSRSETSDREFCELEAHT